jgi:hypothetical protein
LLAQGRIDDWILLEDATDLARFLEVTGRTVPSSTWTDEAVNERNEAFAVSAF